MAGRPPARDFTSLAGIAAHPNGGLVIADQQSNRIVRVSPSGVLNTIAGNGLHAFYAPQVPALNSGLDWPTAIVVDAAGVIYFSELHSGRVGRFWLRGGTALGGQRAVGIEESTDAIRSTGAQQLIAVPAFHDRLGFQGLPDDLLVAGGNTLYEAHPSYDFGFGDSTRQSAFGFLASPRSALCRRVGSRSAGEHAGLCRAPPRYRRGPTGSFSTRRPTSSNVRSPGPPPPSNPEA